MKKLLTLLFSITLIFSTPAALIASSNDPLPITAQECANMVKPGNPGDVDLYLCRQGYVTGYDFKTKQPKWVAYELTKQSVQKHIKRKDRFKADDAVPEKYQSELDDYKHSGYDRGHMAPYATVDISKKSARQSFLLSNISPQKPGLNRYGWRQLEEDVRDWAIHKGKIYVVTGPIFKDGKVSKTIGNGVGVPDAYFKVIYAPKQRQAIAFIMPNKSVSSKKIAKYRTSIEEVQDQTRLQFLTDLPDKLRKKLISNKYKMWKTY